MAIEPPDADEVVSSDIRAALATRLGRVRTCLLFLADCIAWSVRCPLCSSSIAETPELDGRRGSDKEAPSEQRRQGWTQGSGLTSGRVTRPLS